MHTISSLKLATLGLISAFALSSVAQATALSLDRFAVGVAPSGTAVGGLNATWYKTANNANFSNYSYTETDPTSPRVGETAPIKTFSWGTGIWSVGDVADMANGSNPFVTKTSTSVGAVNYANNIYNNTTMSGAYGTWAQDHTRDVAPIVGASNGCNVATQNAAACANEQNYAATFKGYVYIGAAGSYDFGLFVDDAFSFKLTGANGSIGMGMDTVVGSQGRDVFTLQSENHLDALMLDVGYYALDISYFNRLEAGVIDLGWLTPGSAGFTTITEGDLSHDVPEPESLTLVALGLLLAQRISKRRLAQA